MVEESATGKTPIGVRIKYLLGGVLIGVCGLSVLNLLSSDGPDLDVTERVLGPCEFDVVELEALGGDATVPYYFEIWVAPRGRPWRDGKLVVEGTRVYSPKKGPGFDIKWQAGCKVDLTYHYGELAKFAPLALGEGNAFEARLVKAPEPSDPPAEK